MTFNKSPSGRDIKYNPSMQILDSRQASRAEPRLGASKGASKGVIFKEVSEFNRMSPKVVSIRETPKFQKNKVPALKLPPHLCLDDSFKTSNVEASFTESENNLRLPSSVALEEAPRTSMRSRVSNVILNYLIDTDSAPQPIKHPPRAAKQPVSLSRSEMSNRRNIFEGSFQKGHEMMRPTFSHS